MRVFEILKVPAPLAGKEEPDKNEVEHIDMYLDLAKAMFFVENNLLAESEAERIFWEMDEWGNAECYIGKDMGNMSDAPDSHIKVHNIEYAGYMIKYYDVID